MYQCQRVALPTSCDNGCKMSVSPSHMSWYGAVQQVLAVKLYLHTQRVTEWGTVRSQPGLGLQPHLGQDAIKQTWLSSCAVWPP